jgi:hypothetical protein
MEVFGEKHLETLCTMGDLACVYFAQGQCSEAKEMEIRTLDLRKKNMLGDSHPETLYIMSSLAMSYSKLNRHGEAEELSGRALDLQKENLGERHPDTMQSMRYLAEIYYRQGQYEKVVDLAAEVMSLCRGVFEDGHPSTQITSRHLATYRSKYVTEPEGIQAGTCLLTQTDCGQNQPILCATRRGCRRRRVHLQSGVQRQPSSHHLCDDRFLRELRSVRS